MREGKEGATAFPIFCCSVHQITMKNRTRSHGSKEKKGMERKSVFSVMAREDIKKEKAKPKEELAVRLKADVKNINDNIMKEGERLFFTRIPEKVVELTEYMDVSVFCRKGTPHLTLCRRNLFSGKRSKRYDRKSPWTSM